jgi:hypothetical protein
MSVVNGESNKASAFLAMFLDSCNADGNYRSLCDARIDVSQLQDAVGIFKDCGGTYMIVAPDTQDVESFYGRRSEKGLPLPKDHYVFGIISIDRNDRNNPIKDYRIYGVVKHDVKNGAYCITEFGVGKKENEDNPQNVH